MYTLRIIIEERSSEKEAFEQVVENHALGNSYRVAKKGNGDGVRSVVFSEKGETWFVMDSEKNTLYSYFIMTENGKTFERL